METLSPKSSISPKPAPATSVNNSRLWRSAAQRNLRNQWSQMLSFRQQWLSSSQRGRSHATSLVNAFLSQKYMPTMELGVLSDLADIRKKACSKLFKQQELHRSKLLSSYKDLVAVVTHMVKTSTSMRCFLKGTSNSPLVQFSNRSEDKNDAGDGGGIPIFAFWPMTTFENLAEELVQMFALELNLKRLLVVELLSLSSEVPQIKEEFYWSDELYQGEFNDLHICDLIPVETCEPIPPRLKDRKCDMPYVQSNHQPNHEILQVYLTTWLAEVNIDTHRLNEIFTVIGEEMHVALS
ncbi:hypothetical protein CFOL_v3_28716 [Cephalotus follicularis]|uniref:Uncharacterized protein n=1 Tax=Cephalotus follicularis TaxID=3775 RepID=A0A1Q3CYW0_CEPFO|nr:hypothetical protein CFOL_v3_28716 [Cephalotus follicularis]